MLSCSLCCHQCHTWIWWLPDPVQVLYCMSKCNGKRKIFYFLKSSIHWRIQKWSNSCDDSTALSYYDFFFHMIYLDVYTYTWHYVSSMISRYKLTNRTEHLSIYLYIFKRARFKVGHMPILIYLSELRFWWSTL